MLPEIYSFVIDNVQGQLISFQSVMIFSYHGKKSLNKFLVIIKYNGKFYILWQTWVYNCIFSHNSDYKFLLDIDIELTKELNN